MSLPSSEKVVGGRVLAASMVLLLLIFGVFGQVLNFGLVDYDDTVLLSGNPYIREGLSWEGLKWAFFFQDAGQSLRAGIENLWHPLTWVSHMLDYEFWGASYRLHHATSLALHGVATFLVFWVFSQWLRSLVGGFLVACLFAIHPMHVETVAWLSDRKGLLSACGFFLSLGLYQESRGVMRRFRVASALVFCLALLAKPSVVILPGILVLIDTIEKRKDVPCEFRAWMVFQIRDKWMWGLPALAATVIALLAQGSGTHGVVGPLSARLMAMPANLLDYGIKWVWPVGLTYHNAAPNYAGSWVASAFLWFCLVAALLAVWRRRVRQPVLFVSVAWWILCWLPVSGLVAVGTSFTCDRYSYLMFCGAFFGLVSLWLVLFGKQRILASGLAVGVIGGFGVLSFWQVGVWKNSQSLFAHAYRWQAQDLTVVINQATITQRQGKLAEALAYYEQARKIAPKDPVVLFNLAVVKASQRDFSASAKLCREAVASNAGFAPGWLQLGLMLARGQVEPETADETRFCLVQACEASDFKDPKAVLALAEVYLDSGRRNELLALVERTRGLKISDPRLAEMMSELRQRFP